MQEVMFILLMVGCSTLHFCIEIIVLFVGNCLFVKEYNIYIYLKILSRDSLSSISSKRTIKMRNFMNNNEKKIIIIDFFKVYIYKLLKGILK